MRRQGRKEYSSVFGVARALFYFLSLLVSCASRLTPVTCVNQIQENSKMRKGEKESIEASNEPQTGSSLVATENRFIAPITVAAVCFSSFFFFLLDPLRLNDVSLYHATRKTFLCFAFSFARYWTAPLGTFLPSKHPSEKGFSATDIFAI